MRYQLKKIMFRGKPAFIVMQNQNGPCPLLAIANALVLRRDIQITNERDEAATITGDILLSIVSEYILDHCKPTTTTTTTTTSTDATNTNNNNNTDNDYTLVTDSDQEKNLDDVMNSVLPKLQEGLDVNVKFSGVFSFEYSKELIVFDLCRMRLAHGWLCDPQSDVGGGGRNEVYEMVTKSSYNSLVLNLLSLKSPVMGASHNDEMIHNGLLTEKFLNDTATQLTYHGLSELHAGLREEEICVFFRNNHFSTMLKHHGELYLLATDLGFANTSLAWEKLAQIDGDSNFYTGEFKFYEAISPLVKAKYRDAADDENLSGHFKDELTLEDGKTIQEENDLLVAKQIQESEAEFNNQRDLALALEMQQKENSQGRRGDRDQDDDKVSPRRRDRCIVC